MTNTNDEDALLQALRNLWPILSADGRRKALHLVNYTNSRKPRSSK